MKSILAVMCFLMIFVSPLQAEIYKWTDEKGTVHFTEDLSSIPENYRGGAETRKTHEDRMTGEEKTKDKQREDEVQKRQTKERLEYEQSLKQKLKEIEAEANEKRNRKETCSACEGRGTKRYNGCGGKGYHLARTTLARIKCSACNGSGFLSCPACKGKGTVPVGTQ